MKLKIKNYEKIKGAYQKLWIEDVTEWSDRYVFQCSRLGERVRYDVILYRDGRIDHEGDWIYHFYDWRGQTQSVTPGWFQNIGNAVSAIISEFDSQYGL